MCRTFVKITSYVTKLSSLKIIIYIYIYISWALPLNSLQKLLIFEGKRNIIVECQHYCFISFTLGKRQNLFCRIR